VHASASPFEAMCELHTWLRTTVANTGFGQAR
jgi:hypothetical protein